MQELLDYIRKEASDRRPSDVEELVLDGQQISYIHKAISSELENFRNLVMLSLNDCELESLENLPQIKNLLRLELSNNPFPPKELVLVGEAYPNLVSLSLCNYMHFVSWDDINVLKRLPKLIQLDLIGCPVVSDNPKTYREKVFQMFPNLKLLDNLTRRGEEVYYDEFEDIQRDAPANSRQQLELMDSLMDDGRGGFGGLGKFDDDDKGYDPIGKRSF
eukprot:TRINITY_DN7368_c0_g1_i3.p1 TRINITY_DN7368_c0_g1~~TRINITY_DN7368_c0_g1_i3.p1  ORF type:complete len:218 (-),score=43.56 TRINITY_DN7368_c0_g1_i3:114-767(-)